MRRDESSLLDIAEAARLVLAFTRDHLIHAYDTVDLDEVWKTATRDVPELLAAIEPLLPEKSAD